MSLKVEKVLVSLVVIQFPDLIVRVNLNILICYHVCYISAQVADFMSSVGNRLIGGKSTVAVENFIAIGRPTVLLVSWRYRFSTCYESRLSVLVWGREFEHINDITSSETPSVVEQNLYKYRK